MKTFAFKGAVALALLVASVGATSAQVGGNLNGGGSGTKPGTICGDSGHALGWTGTAYNCQAITGVAAAGGSNTQLQYNNASALAGITGATTNGTVVTLTSAVFITPALGTPASGVLTNATGLPISTGVSGLGTGVATFLGTPSSANFAAALTDETGTGLAVLATNPVLVTPNLGTPSAITLTNGTGLPVSTGVSGLGTGVAAALAIAKDTSGGVCTVGGGGCAGGGSVSVTAATSNVVINPTPGTGTFTVGITNTLRETTTTSESITSADLTKLVSTNNASAIAVTVPQATGSMASGAAWNQFNYGAGIATLTPTTSTLCGKTSQAFGVQQGASIFANGAGNYGCIMGLPQVAQYHVLGTTASGNNYPIDTTISGILDGAIGSTSGMLAYRDGTSWRSLTLGTNLSITSNVLNATGGGGGSTYTATFTGNVSGTPGAAGLGLALATATFTDNNTAGSGTAALFAVHSVAAPTIAASNTSVTTTHATSLYLGGVPITGTNETVTAKTAEYIAAGDLAFGTAGQKISMYNLGSPGATNREVGSLGWVANVLTLATAVNGTGANYAISVVAPGGVITIDSGTGTQFAYGGTNKVSLGSSYLAQAGFVAWLLQNNVTVTNATPAIIPNSNGGGITNSGLGGGTDGSVSLDVLGVEVLRASANKHLQTTGTTATAASNSVAATCTDHCNDNAGRFTVGATPNASLVLTFAGTWSTAPVCFAQDETAGAMMPVSAVSTTTATFTKSSTLTASDKVSYSCIGTL